MSRYKIVCNDVAYLGKVADHNKYHGATFEGVAYTDDAGVVLAFNRDLVHNGSGKRLFEVYEVDDNERG